MKKSGKTYLFYRELKLVPKKLYNPLIPDYNSAIDSHIILGEYSEHAEFKKNFAGENEFSITSETGVDLFKMTLSDKILFNNRYVIVNNKDWTQKYAIVIPSSNKINHLRSNKKNSMNKTLSSGNVMDTNLNSFLSGLKRDTRGKVKNDKTREISTAIREQYPIDRKIKATFTDKIIATMLFGLGRTFDRIFFYTTPSDKIDVDKIEVVTSDLKRFEHVTQQNIVKGRMVFVFTYPDVKTRLNNPSSFFEGTNTHSSWNRYSGPTNKKTNFILFDSEKSSQLVDKITKETKNCHSSEKVIINIRLAAVFGNKIVYVHELDIHTFTDEQVSDVRNHPELFNWNS